MTRVIENALGAGDKYGGSTPYYLFQRDVLRENAKAAWVALGSLPFGFRGGMYYSLKTNPHPDVLTILREEGFGAECISYRELGQAVSAGFRNKLILNGPCKKESDLSLAASFNTLIQVDSLSEAKSLLKVAHAENIKIIAGVRVNPGIVAEDALNGVRMGSNRSVFGLDPDGYEFQETIKLLYEDDLVSLDCLSAHIGTGITSTISFRLLAQKMTTICSELNQQGMGIHFLNLGGGFSIQSEVRYTEHNRTRPDKIATFAEICEAIGKEVDKPVILEPGRLLVSDCFHLVTKVIRIKEDRGKRFAIVDAGRFQNAQFVNRGYHEIVPVYPSDKPALEYTIVGPLCAGFEEYATRELPELSEGDILLVMDVGAYNLSAQCNWSFERAPVIEV